MKVEYDFKGNRKIVEIGNDESEAKIREREYILYTYLEKSPVENISGTKRIPKSARTTYIADAKNFFKRVLDKGLIVSEKPINPFNINKQNIDFLKNILDNVWKVESYKEIDSSISSNAPRAFLQHLIDFVEKFTMPKIWWLNISEQEKYWKEQYPFDKWQLGTNNDMLVYECRDNVTKGDIAIFYFTGDIKAIRYIGRVYKIDEYIYFDMLSKIEKGFVLQEIRNMNGLESYPPQSGFSKMGNQQIALELVIKCFENGQSQQNMTTNQNLEKQENKPITNTDSTKGENMKTTPPLNQILYGPPGTGKTYNTINKALEILGEKIDGKSRAEIKAKFDEYQQNGQIEFVTFHQSFSYEEFVEGIKPKLKNSNDATESSEMSYTIKSGIFKEICKSALNNLQDSQKDETTLNAENQIANLFEAFIEHIQNEQENGKEYSLDNKKNWLVSILYSSLSSDYRVIKIFSHSGYLENYPHFLNDDKIKGYYKDFKSNHNFKIPSKENRTGYIDTHRFYTAFFKKMQEFETTWAKHNKQTKTNIDNALKPYILIIDEINRGNISKILGELITLIEPSKRIGASDEEKARGIGNESLEVTLPYSNKSFGVPSNLYIIGTMNTTDRSIALLDTALRRRFEFVEMMPDCKELQKIWLVNKIGKKDSSIESWEGEKGEDGYYYSRVLFQMLTAINNRIEFLLDREHTIGHAFFFEKAIKKDGYFVLSLDSLKEIFAKKIIPLLQEYFYDDYAKIDAVLNGNGMIKSFSKQKLEVNLSDDFVDSDKKVYRITDSNMWKKENFQRIYDSSIKIDENESK